MASTADLQSQNLQLTAEWAALVARGDSLTRGELQRAGQLQRAITKRRDEIAKRQARWAAMRDQLTNERTSA